MGSFVESLIEVWYPHTWNVAVSIWLIFFSYCVYAGRSSTIEANAAFLRLLGVSAYLATLGTIPAMILAAAARQQDFIDEAFLVTIGATIVNFFALAPWVAVPVNLPGTRQSLPLVKDPALLTRIASIAKKMDLPTPLVRLWPSVGEEQNVWACAGTLSAPQLVVCDGILHRIENDECDAILAHELGHIANGSLWLYPAIIPTGCALMTLSALILPWYVVIPIGIAFVVGFSRVVSRSMEMNCDNRAARAIGFRATASALKKLHAAIEIPSTGFLSCLIFATATHPSRDVRIAALYDVAPQDDRPEYIPNRSRIRIQNATSFIALAIWLGVMIYALITALSGEGNGWLQVPLWVTAALPTGFMRLLPQKRRVYQQNRIRNQQNSTQPSEFGTSSFLFVAAFVGLILLIITAPRLLAFEAGSGIVVVTLLTLFAGLSWYILWGIYLNLKQGRSLKKLQQKIANALQVHNFQRVLDLCAEHREVVSKETQLRYHLQLANAASGNRDVAIEGLEQLRRDEPRFPMAAIVLSQLLLEVNRPERVLEVLKEIAPRLRNDPALSVLKGRALRRMGRIDEAQAVCSQAMTFNSDEGAIQGITAAIELDKGQFEQAQVRIEKALELAPGDVYLLTVRAEILLKTQSEVECKIELSKAIQAVRNNPFALLHHEVHFLESELETLNARPQFVSNREIILKRRNDDGIEHKQESDGP